ncbi:MAG: DNA-binding response regulator [Gemmatimonadetes bacterium]|nr:MAG: DNA-binding response regulator [Gemmatimonadota bacterium]
MFPALAATLCGPRRFRENAEALLAQRIRVLIIDDNRLMRGGLSALLKAQPDLHVVGAVANLAAALRRLVEVTLHVVLVDAGLGSYDGLRCVEQIRRSTPAARVIVMDLLPAPEEVVAYVKAGAKGFIMKDATVADFLGTVRSVAKGSDVIPPVLVGTLLSHIAEDAVVHQRPEAADAVRMTKREQEVMQLITEGLDNKAIAQRLSVAGDTVKSHVRNILEKLTLHSRLAIAAHSRRSDAARRNPSA